MNCFLSATPGDDQAVHQRPVCERFVVRLDRGSSVTGENDEAAHPKTSNRSNYIVPNDGTTFTQSHAAVTQRSAQLYDFAGRCADCGEKLLE